MIRSRDTRERTGGVRPESDRVASRDADRVCIVVAQPREGAELDSTRPLEPLGSGARVAAHSRIVMQDDVGYAPQAMYDAYGEDTAFFHHRSARNLGRRP